MYVVTGTLITVAPTGAESAKADAPTLPCTLDELVSAAKACQAAGAAVIHVHVRDDAAQPTLDVGRVTASVQAIREATDLVVQVSSGGAAGGQVRVGMEDTLTFAPGRPVRDNAELVERAAAVAHLAQRPPLTPEAAREMLGIKDRRSTGTGAG